MKVLLCSNSFEVVTNGPAKFAKLLFQYAQEHEQDEIRILTEDVSIQLPGIYKMELRIPSLFRPAGMFIRMFQYHRRAMQIRKEFPFDVLVYNNATVALRSALTFKNTIGFINDDNHARLRWIPSLLRFRKTKSYVFFLTEWLACKMASRIIVNSDYLRSTILRRYRASPRKVFRLYKGVEIPNTEHTVQNIVPEILFVKNDYKRAGLFVLAEALKKLGRPCKIIIAGTPAAHDAEIRGAFLHPGITCEIRNFISQSEVYELMKQADLFCVPSLNEALGVANIEAMRLGCPVVTTRVGGIPEVTDNGDCAWLVEPGDSDALKDAIATCLDHEPERKEKVQRAHHFSLQFSVEAMYTNFISILAS